MGDPAQLESAVLNLALNARDAMPGGGRLTIELGNTLQADVAVVLAVEDVVVLGEAPSRQRPLDALGEVAHPADASPARVERDELVFDVAGRAVRADSALAYDDARFVRAVEAVLGEQGDAEHVADARGS
ncbi:ATP-binding protein [Methylorubrum populi]|jgi:hypothetical protein|uniref:hypothetical protein n=1 Tax=Methylorubrum populi TaxID=223967 RepID=UPI00130189A4|nr:hypothetical protein [Methylorubrum populi]